MVRRITAMGSILAGAVLASAAPLLADVKAGVDAWAQGNYAAAIREWQGPASQGDADAQFNLAQAYKFGKGVPQDLTKAEDLFGKAAAKDHIQAADNYGLLRFQRGDRSGALPYIQDSAARGDARAQYLLGISNFNGDIVPKDWVRAYALLTLARQAGLPQANSAISQMDTHIPLEQRQQAAALASQLGAQAEATRARQLATADLSAGAPATISHAPVAPGTSPIAKPEQAVITAAHVAGSDSPRTAGADFARPPAPSQAIPSVQAPKPIPPAPAVAPKPAVRTAAPAPAASGPWRVQLGAFGVRANADALWNRVKDRPEIAGHFRMDAGTGSVKRLQASGFASEGDAKRACSRLSAAGFACLVMRN